MEIYIILMVALAAFFYRESRRISKGVSTILPNFQGTSEASAFLSKMLRFVAVSALISGGFMLLALIYSRIYETKMPLIPAALSFLVYGAGFMIALYRIYKMQQEK